MDASILWERVELGDAMRVVKHTWTNRERRIFNLIHKRISNSIAPYAEGILVSEILFILLGKRDAIKYLESEGLR